LLKTGLTVTHEKWTMKITNYIYFSTKKALYLDCQRIIVHNNNLTIRLILITSAIETLNRVSSILYFGINIDDILK
jgi:hypothetical protein